MKASIQDFITKIFTQIKNNFGNVDNTSDTDKPISKAQQAEFDKVNNNLDGLAYGENAGASNLWDEQWELGGLLWSNGSLIDLTDRIRSKNYIEIKPNTTYTATGSAEKGACFYDSNKTFIESNTYIVSTFTTPNNAKYMLFINNSTTYNNDIAIIEGTRGTYKPYIPSVKMLADEVSAQNDSLEDLEFLGWSVPKDCPIQNYVDSNGVFHQRVGRVDLGSLSWTSMSANRLSAIFKGYKKVANSVKPNAYTNKYSVVNRDNSTVDKSFTLYSSSDGIEGIIICDSSYTDATAFKNAMQGIYLYYELETEKTIAVGSEVVTELKNDLDGKMNVSNPIGTGSFSLNRKAGSTVGTKSFAEGNNTTASGNYSHAEGYGSKASGQASHAEGDYSIASGFLSHAEGESTTASGNYSHAEGNRTIANGESQHVQGKFNVADTTSAFIIGNGTDNSARSNAMKVDWNGNLEVAGDLKDGNGNTLSDLGSCIYLDTERLSGFNISSNGKVSSDSTFDLIVAKVTPGMKITATTDVYAFYTFKPSVNGDTSYDGTRTTSALNNTTVPDGVSYIAYRIGAGASIPKLKALNIGNAINYVTTSIAGINTNRVIAEITSSVSGTKWVATEDCWIVGELISTNSTGSVLKVNNIIMFSAYTTTGSLISVFACTPVKKGQQVALFACESKYARTFKAYGVLD